MIKSIRKNSVCYIKTVRGGLANRLLIWAPGVIFARLNNLPFCNSKWYALHLGPIIRGEKSKRFYRGMLKESSLIKKVIFKVLSVLRENVANPALHLQIQKGQKLFYTFDFLNMEDYFEQIKKYRKIVIEEFEKLINPSILALVNKHPLPQVALHIRRGDFLVGKQTTDLSYFLEVILQLKKDISSNVTFTIFTDGHKEELEDILRIENVAYHYSGNDLCDLLLMSKSKIIVTSHNSTYSYWAGFIGKGIIIRTPNDTRNEIRNEPDLIEFKWSEYLMQDELKKKVKSCVNHVNE